MRTQITLACRVAMAMVLVAACQSHTFTPRGVEHERIAGKALFVVDEDAPTLRGCGAEVIGWVDSGGSAEVSHADLANGALESAAAHGGTHVARVSAWEATHNTPGYVSTGPGLGGGTTTTYMPPGQTTTPRARFIVVRLERDKWDCVPAQFRPQP